MRDFDQTDEHPVVSVTWKRAMDFCDWLSSKTGKGWRLPTNAEWSAAVGMTAYPWGDYFPPRWDDGNYSLLDDGKNDPKFVGVDGILKTAPVGSFKPNALDFYDLGGNASEWVLDEFDENSTNRVTRGASWHADGGNFRSSDRRSRGPMELPYNGLRLVRRSGH